MLEPPLLAFVLVTCPLGLERDFLLRFPRKEKLLQKLSRVPGRISINLKSSVPRAVPQMILGLFAFHLPVSTPRFETRRCCTASNTHVGNPHAQSCTPKT